eukprot:9359816-Ditylum_brightwellii.AAC.1
MGEWSNCLNDVMPLYRPVGDQNWTEAHEVLETFSTEVVTGIIDGTLPEVYGIPALELPPEMHPSKELVVLFTEEVYCKEPFDFSLSESPNAGWCNSPLDKFRWHS